MKSLLPRLCAILFLCSCANGAKQPDAVNSRTEKNSLPYDYTATYSSNITAGTSPENERNVLHVWKMFEQNKIDSMRPYFADTVLYESSGGHRYHGSSEGLLKIAGSDFDKLDSMRFDIFTWQSVHVNDKNEDWVYIWGAERQYGKDGTADTSLIHEQWKIENHKVTYFNQFNAKPAH